MKKTIALVLMTAVWLAGCSGRTDEDVAEDPNDPLVIAAAQAGVGEIRLLTTSPSLQTGSIESASIVAIVTDNNNRALDSQDVSFSSDGGVLQNIVPTTTESGEATAELNLAGDYRNGNISVTARVGDHEATVLVAATGSVIEFTAPENLILGDTPDLEIKLLAGSGQPIPNQVVTLSSTAGNTFSQNSATTDASGVVTIAVSTSAGADTLTATALDGTVVTEFKLEVAENIQAVLTPVRVRVISNESSIETGGNDVARITTLVTDESNRVVTGKEVEFSSTGGVLQNISSITSAAGQATAELSLAGDFRNQDIVVTAMVDEQEGSVLLTTSGSSLSIAGPTALVSGNTAELEITLSGGNDQPISNELISITSGAGNTLSQDTVTTDASGKAIVVVGSTAGDDEITVAALESTVIKVHSINVAEDILSVIDPQNYDSLGVDSLWPFQVLWESNGQPVVGGELKFSVTAGELRLPGDASGASSVIAITDANGIATVEVESNAAGPATIAFSDSADADPFSQFDVEFIAVDIANISMEAAPASVATGNPSTIYASVTDDFGNPVKDVVVEFSSPNLKGGSLSPVTAVTDSDGKAGITFTAGSIPSEENELVIQATASEQTSVSSEVNLTVTERQLNVIIGLAGTVTEADSDTRYRKAGLVQVTDGAGRPVPDATITVSMIPTNYRYGQLGGVDTDNDGEADAWARLPLLTYACESEDKNVNRVLDTPVSEDLNSNGVLDEGEDTNQNGRLDINEDVNSNGVLDPSDPGLVDSDPVNLPTVIGGQITTDANGVGFFSMAYPQSNAWWFDVLISARVQALGVEVVAEYGTELSAVSTDVNDIEKLPPNYISPYGQFLIIEDRNGNRVLDDGEDFNSNGLLDIDEDVNGNGVLDDGEDVNGNGLLDTLPVCDQPPGEEY